MKILLRRKKPSIQKKGHIQKIRIFKRIKTHKKNLMEIVTPHNTSQYLIENNSTPFYADDDLDADFIPIHLLL